MLLLLLLRDGGHTYIGRARDPVIVFFAVSLPLSHLFLPAYGGRREGDSRGWPYLDVLRGGESRKRRRRRKRR